jgi:hypothetical protein
MHWKLLANTFVVFVAVALIRYGDSSALAEDSGAAAGKPGGQVGNELVTISIPSDKWVPLTPGSWPLGHSGKFDLAYKNHSYKNTIARITFDLLVKEGSRKKPYTSVFSYDFPLSSPEGMTSVILMSNTKLEGTGVIQVYLTEKLPAGSKRQPKTISNIVSIPAAAGPEAQKELEAKLGPCKISQQGSAK